MIAKARRWPHRGGALVNWRASLPVKILLLALLNVLLLGVVIVAFARLQFQLDLGSLPEKI